MPSEQITVTRIGPHMDGQRMSLADFAHAEADEGYLYELERGVIVVDVPDVTHELVVQNVRSALDQLRVSHPGIIYLISGGLGCVMRLPGMASERHPDVAVYLTPPPGAEGNAEAWDQWCPEIVVEVISSRSVRRDYEIKRDEYLSAGVQEYVIIDLRKRSALILSRRGESWQEQPLDSSGTWSTNLLPGFGLALTNVFARPAAAPR